MHLIVASTFFILTLTVVFSQTNEDVVEYWIPGVGNIAQSVTGLVSKTVQGDSKAALALGWHFDHKGDMTNAIKYLTMAAQKGESEAQYELGQLWLGFRQESVKDYVQARYWLTVAETNGWEYEARSAIGELNYLEGKGECLISMCRAFDVFWVVYNRCKQLQYGTELANADQEIDDMISIIRDERTLFRVLMLLSFCESESEQQLAYRRYIKRGVDQCLNKLMPSNNGRLLVKEYLNKAQWLSKERRREINGMLQKR